MKKKCKIRVFRVFVLVYTVILIVCSIVFLSYVDKCLKEYEKAQSENAMPNIMYHFKNMIEDGTISQYIEIPKNMEMLDEANVKNAYVEQLRQYSGFYYEKDSASYLTEEPIFDIFAQGELIGKIRLKGCNERTILGILTIMDWKAQSIEPVFEMTIKARNVSITVPENYKVIFDERELTKDDIKGDKIPIEGMDNLNEFVKLPESVKYEVKTTQEENNITIYNEKGKKVKFKQDKKGNIVIPITFKNKKITQEREDIAYEIAKMWEDFVTNDLSGSSHGLATIQEYLVKDSYYYNLAKEYANGPDIGLVSDHTIANPGYTDLKIDNYIEYSDNSFSCHVYFKKHMNLTRAHNKLRTETVDSTFYFVYIDDTTEETGNEDNIDNPHWCMVDMVATTQ